VCIPTRQDKSERHGSRKLGDQGAGAASRTVALGRKVWMLRRDVVERLGLLHRSLVEVPRYGNLVATSRNRWGGHI
jgi:hypothetical protein